MKRHWVIVFIVLLSGIALIAFFFAKPKILLNDPVRIPTRTEIVPPGSSTQDLLKTADESRMSQMMRPTLLVRQTTERLFEASCTGGTDYCKLQAIYHFVRLNFEFTERTLESQYIRAPSEMLLYGRGDEVELALLIASMQRSAGFRNEIVRSPLHAWVRTYYDNRTFMIDPSCAGCTIMESHVTLRGDEAIYD